jgi:hypothetical protein
MLGNETTFVSSPTDLIGITNAQQVYSVDYYQGDNRVAAVLATATVGLHVQSSLKQFVTV